jgi:hypothetical protein
MTSCLINDEHERHGPTNPETMRVQSTKRNTNEVSESSIDHGYVVEPWIADG